MGVMLTSARFSFGTSAAEAASLSSTSVEMLPPVRLLMSNWIIPLSKAPGVSQESSDYTECPNLNGLLILWQAIVPALYPLAILPFDQSRHPPVDTIRSVTDPPRVPARWTLILLQV